MKQNSIRNIVNLALLVALALAVSVVEMMIPLPVPIPGAKLGLSNIIILVTIYFYDFKSSLTVSVLKSFLLVLITGSVMSFFYSLLGAILSTISMYFSLRYSKDFLSLIGISEIGAFFHNLGQIIVAMIFMNNVKMIYYFPALVLIGVFTGFFVGLSSNYIIVHLKKLNFRIAK
ncbi:MAG: Gx transporter family protein [Peptoniphilaceae bacterium]|nr:Gx transporter family protein [Peptoniphilaceae bacterium]MDY6018582.1 Gx transporter family protein [Anaerococcus sp.]